MRPQEVRSEVATFLNLARHFDQLKKRSLDLKARFGVRDRGYFTPAEEEEAARLFISYVHVRNALLESVLERRQSGLTEASADAFVLCLGGAALLVDAAVFVRDSFGDHPAIRSKLNERNPVFGIPPGTYDRIQESLTDPANNWHLQQAWKHYEKSRAELLVKATGCASVIERIDRLAGLFSGSLQAYLKERMTVFGNRIVKGVVTQTFGKLIYGVQKSFSSMISDLSTRPEHRPGLPAEIDQELRRLLRPGDVLLTRKEHVLTNYFLPGYWPHGALNLGSVESLRELGLAQRENFRQRQEEISGLDPDDSTRAMEALKDGVHLRTLGSPLGSDSVIVIRPDLSDAQLAQALDRVLQHAGKPYDFDFDFTRADRMVCTEVIYRAYDGIGDLEFRLTKRAGRMTLSAMDLIQMALQGEHFDVVAAFIPGHAAELLHERDAVDAIHALA